MINLKKLTILKEILIFISQKQKILVSEVLKKKKISKFTLLKYIKYMQTFMAIDIKIILNKIYVFPGPYFPLNQKVIMNKLNMKSLNFIKNIICYDCVSSTNKIIYKIMNMNKKKYGICISEMQTFGIGSRYKIWQSPFGYNIYISILWTFKYSMLSKISILNILVAIVSVKILQKYKVGKYIKIKWPNDIFYNDQKIGGILIERYFDKNKMIKCIIGIGINGYLSNFLKKKILQNSTSFFEETGKILDRNSFIADLINQLISDLGNFKYQELFFLLNEWKKFDFFYKKKIIFTSSHHTIEGIGMGIANNGLYLIKNSKNQIIKLFHYPGKTKIHLHTS